MLRRTSHILDLLRAAPHPVSTRIIRASSSSVSRPPDDAIKAQKSRDQEIAAPPKSESPSEKNKISTQLKNLEEDHLRSIVSFSFGEKIPDEIKIDAETIFPLSFK